MLRRILLLVLALVLTACSSSGGSTTASQTPSELNDNAGGGRFAGIGLDPAQPRPSFTLTDTSGAKFPFSRTAGHPTFLFFGYTHCPDVCPATMANIRLALEKVPTTVQRSTYVVFVTTDVKRDTGPVLARWLRHFTPGIAAHVVGLRGTQDEIDAAQAASRIPLAEDGGQTHSALVMLYGRDDYARVQYAQSNNQIELMAHDLPLVS